MAELRERNALPSIGPRFFRDDDGEVRFEFVIDATNVVGPRPATKADSEKHVEAWAVFTRPELDVEPEPAPERQVPLSPTAEEPMERAFAHLEAARQNTPTTGRQKRPGPARKRA